MLGRSRSRNKRRQDPPRVEESDDNDDGDQVAEIPTRSSNHNHDDHRLLYSAPTVDTLGDESVLMRPYATPRNHVPLPASQRPAPTTSNGYSFSLPLRPPSQNVSSASRNRVKINNHNNVKNNNMTTSRSGRRRNKTPRTDRDFQHEEDCMSVSVRTLSLQERSAFTPTCPPLISTWQQRERVSGGGNNKKQSQTQTQSHKLSPSWQHLQLLHKLHGISHIRQHAFTPSVGASADFLPWQQEEFRNPNNPNNPKQLRDGRYRSIDPVQATLAALPPTPPLLSNRKHRLPLRSDVGFPNASYDEMIRKQSEIQQETEWEEASPRLIVLVTSDDLGTAVQVEEQDDDDELTALPYSGPELVQAKERNQKHFGRRRRPNDKNGGVQQEKKKTSSLWNKSKNANVGQLQNLHGSMLAPPLDSTYSPTYIWRPRLYADRPPLYQYLASVPLQVEFGEVGSVGAEPLIGCMSLYSLPLPSSSLHAAGGISCGGGCKVSEDFYFPIGDWKGRNMGGGQGGENDQTLKMMNNKAIFSYHPLYVHAEHLTMVCQIYKVTHVEATAAYLGAQHPYHNNHHNSNESGKSSVWRKRPKKRGGSSPSSSTLDCSSTTIENWSVAQQRKTRARAHAVLDNFGTQFLTPLCFGVSTGPLWEDQTSKSFHNHNHDDDNAEGNGNDDNDHKKWPKGETQTLQLYLAPTQSESQEDFCERLLKLKQQQQQASAVASVSPTTTRTVTTTGSSSSSMVETSREGLSLAAASSTENNMSSPPGKKKGLGRFLSPKKSSRREILSPSPAKPSKLPSLSSTSTGAISTTTEESIPIVGKVTLFTSYLDTDFLQPMLVTPPELLDNTATTTTGVEETKPLPKLLVDVSGDSAIMVDNKGVVSLLPMARKRSTLVRLPQANKPGQYVDAAEFREVLFLPPRPEKSYSTDVPPSFRSLLNLLYLYPRLLIRQDGSNNNDISSSKNSKKGNYTRQRYSIRIRLVGLVQSHTKQKTGDPIVETVTKALEYFHNPAPWAGKSMLNAVYTRIPGDAFFKHDPDDLNSGIPIKDEFKLRLPTVLDGSYFLHFSLFAVDLDEGDESTNVHIRADDNGCGVSLHPVAEATIPLSSSTREPTSGIKVTTIIPNGCHRLKLGDFQLQLETRLVSSIHVADSAVATALRDFPYASNEDEQLTGERLRELSLVTNRSVISRQSSRDIISDRIAYSSLFSTASGSILMGHFQPLLFMHLSNLVSPGSSTRSSIGTTGKFMVENIQSLLEICQRIKLSIQSSSTDAEDHLAGKCRLEAFIKASMDAFDEGILHSSKPKQDSDEDAASEIMQVEESSRSNSNLSAGDDDDEEDEFDGGAIRRRKKDSLPGGIDLRISRTFSAMESSEIPFSRTAYGASKMDRMRLEAELDADTSRFTHLMDDDETVVTTATGMHSSYAESKLAEAREVIADKSFADKWGPSKVSVKAATEDPYASTIEAEAQYDTDPKYYSAYARSLGGMGIVKRVRTAAQVMLAPCVAPNLSNVFATRSSPRHVDIKIHNEDAGCAAQSNTNLKLDKGSRKVEITVSSPGSDIEEEESKRIDEAATALSHIDAGYHTSEGVFRSPLHCPILKFSIRHDRSDELYEVPLARGEFLYESILVLWLRACLEHDEKKESSRATDGREQHKSDSIPVFNADSPMYAFYSHMDVLLPLCLKSIVLRYSQEVPSNHARTARVIADEGHMAVLEPFVERLARGLMVEAMSSLGSSEVDRGLLKATASSNIVLEFLVGLFAVLHPAHMEVLITKYFKSLRESETELLQTKDGEYVFEWTEESLHRIRCSRQLRLRAVEKLAVLPNFIALNYPLKYSVNQLSGNIKKATWTRQYSDAKHDDLLTMEDSQNDNSDAMLPRSGWLAALLTTESLSICALSCEAVVAEAMAQIETHHDGPKGGSKDSSLKKRPTASLKRGDLLMFQSIAIHAITCVHELLLRRHAMDKRFQTEKCRERIAALFAKPIFEKSLASVRWLARMESTHKVRSLWLLCFAYILQEAPENLVRDAVSSYSKPSNPKDVRIHRFIRLLRLSSSTFQSFIDQPRHSMFPSEIDNGISPWLLQESFNTICATTIVVVEECVSPSSTLPKEQKKMIQGILDLLLHVLTTPQSCVTHLRAVGGAIQALEKFGTDMFLEIAGGSLQHWIRVILSLMNSTALSVRSIAVDFVVSLLGSTFDLLGNIDETSLIFITVLPEVMAREIGLCSVSGLIHNLEDVEKSVWPLRRSFADVEDNNPLDDDRVDPQLSPVLSVFCRACQAVIDGVLIEMRLQGSSCNVVGTRMEEQSVKRYTFDADEESLFEAASFFVPETAPVQRIRWLMTLKSLHEAKGQWVEAAESLIMCARTISDSIPHLRHVWRPSRFVLWSDSRRSLWLSTVGEEMGNPEQGNEQVMSFADNFLEPSDILGPAGKPSNLSRLAQPTVSAMCTMLTNISKEAVAFYVREDGMDESAYARLESLLKILMGVLDDHGTVSAEGGRAKLGGLMGRKRYVEEEAALRRVLASISGDMTKIAERLLLIVQDQPPSPASGKTLSPQGSDSKSRPYFVRVLLSGKKPMRFVESTTIPTFLEWNTPCICRVPKSLVESTVAKTAKNPGKLEETMCSEFGKPIRDALLRSGVTESIVFRFGNSVMPRSEATDDSAIHVDISFVQTTVSGVDCTARYENTAWQHSKHFYYRKVSTVPTPSGQNQDIASTLVEMTVAHIFPCALSRQRTLLTSEILSIK